MTPSPFRSLDRLAADRIVVALWDGRQPRLSAPHAHAHGQLFGTFSGLVSVGTEHGRWTVPAGHTVWVPPRCTHEVRSHGPFHGWSAYVHGDACALLPDGPYTFRTTPLLREAMIRLAHPEAQVSKETHGHIASVALDEIAGARHEPLGLPLPADPRLLRIARQLLDQPDAAFGLDHWAQLAAMSTRTLSRHFQRETGMSFDTWRQRARLLCATEKLAAGIPVGTIALDVGYQHASAFIAMFRRHFGQTPTEWLQGSSKNERLQ